ncbi:MAG: hypothetical protein RL154_1122, partial [Pseudomonadota bacterium]
MAYLSLALKYRPRKFSDLIGQEAVAQTLSAALESGKLSHAYLFSGLRGSGKTSSARIFAKSLLCEHGISSNPCEKCSSCIAANDGRHLDIIEMDAASNRKIEDIRNLIESVRYKPAASRYKVYIIDEAHMLTKEAFNAFLKTLEEPPEYVKFILATTDPIKVPPTILSRTLHFRFKKIPFKAVVSHLEYVLANEGVEFDVKALEILARSGEGSLRDTLTLLDQAIVYSKGIVNPTDVASMLGLIDPTKIDALFSAILAKDRQTVVEFAKELEEYDAETALNEISQYIKNKLLNSTMSAVALERFARVVASSKHLLAIGADGDFVVTLAMLKMLEAMDLEEIDDIIKRCSIGHIAQPAQQIQIVQPTVLVQPPKQKSKWDMFLEKAADRDIALGKALKNGSKFISFENNKLQLESISEGAERELVRKYWSVVLEIIKDIFGKETQIVVIRPEQNSTAPQKQSLVDDPLVKEAIKIFE